MNLLTKEDAGWVGKACFAGKSFDSVHFISLGGLFQAFSSRYSYLFSLS